MNAFIAAHSARRVAVELNKFLDLVELLNIVLDTFQCLCTIEIAVVDETESLLQRANDVLLETAAGKADDVRTNHLESPPDHVAQHERRKVLTDLAHTADHCVASHAAELVSPRASADNRPVTEMNVARQLDRVGADHMVAKHDTMRRMAIGHEEDIVAENRLLSVRSSQVNRRKLTNDRAVPNLDIGDTPVLVLKILRLHSNAGIRKNLALLANRCVAADDGALLHNRACADLDIRADAGIRADFDALTELGVLVDDCGRMNDH